MKKLIKLFFNLFGFTISKQSHVSEAIKSTRAQLEKASLLENFFTILTDINFTPGHIVDIGANHGSWTRETLKYFPDAYYTLLEPQHQMRNSVLDLLATNKKITFHAVGAGKAAGDFKFTIAERDDSCTFALSESEANAAGYTQISVPVVVLNEFLPALAVPAPNIIKIDAEGLDLDVLAGASDYFGKTEVFMVEAAVMNKTLENTVLKVAQFMDTNGYKLFDITDLNRTEKHHALWLTELVFIKRGGLIDTAINSYN